MGVSITGLKLDQSDFGPKKGADGSDLADLPSAPILAAKPEDQNIAQIRALSVLSRANIRLIEEPRAGQGRPHNRHPM